MTFRRPSLESLRMLEACVRHASYGRAAAELHISPAAMSQRMRDLQAELGVRLFDRRGPRVTPTDEGRRLAAQVREGLSIVAAAVADCRAMSTVRISAAPTFASRWLAPRLAGFRESHGPIRVAVDAAIDLRPSGSFDLAVRSGRGPWPGYASVRLFPIEGSPMYNPRRYKGAAPSTPADLTRSDLIHSDDWEAWFACAGVPPDTAGLRTSAARYPTQDLAGAAAIEGAGIALLSPRLFADALAHGLLVQPFPTTFESPDAFWLLVTEQEARAPVLALRDWLVGTARQAG